MSDITFDTKVIMLKIETPNSLEGAIQLNGRTSGALRFDLKDVSPQALSDLCDQFRKDIFQKAGVADPRAGKVEDVSVKPKQQFVIKRVSDDAYLGRNSLFEYNIMLAIRFETDAEAIYHIEKVGLKHTCISVPAFERWAVCRYGNGPSEYLPAEGTQWTINPKNARRFNSQEEANRYIKMACLDRSKHGSVDMPMEWSEG